MNASAPSKNRVAVRLAADLDRSANLERHLAGMAADEIVRFDPKDADEMNDALNAGRFDRAVFERMEDLLDAIWDERADIARWRRWGVRIDFVSPPCADSHECQQIVDLVSTGFCEWRRRRLRRQVIVACVLSALAVLAIGVLFQLIPPAR